MINQQLKANQTTQKIHRGIFHMHMQKKFIGATAILLFLTACGPASPSTSNSGSSSATNSSSLPSTSIPVDENAPVFQGMELLPAQPDESLPRLQRQSSPYVVDFNAEAIDAFMPESNPDPLDYYGNPNAQALLHIYFLNPLRFEILSFTFNNEKYQSFQFADGSTSETLILPVTLPSVSGKYSYSIDQIKYVEGTVIKDVQIEGDQTLRVGVTFQQLPTVLSTNTLVSKDTISSQLSVSDPLNILTDPLADLKVFLLQNNEVIDSQDLVLGNQEMSFSSLRSGENYQVTAVALMDRLDGMGYQQHILSSEDLTTDALLAFGGIQVGAQSVSFTLIQADPLLQGQITRIALFEGEELVETLTDVSQREFAGLFSDTTYMIEVDYTYTIANTETIAILTINQSFTTDGYLVPEVSIHNVVSTTNTIAFAVTITDTDSVGYVQAYQLLDNQGLVATLQANDPKIFTGLTPNKVYRLQVVYAYDLLDGYGLQLLTTEVTTATVTALVSVQSSLVLLAGTSTVPMVGEEIQFRLTLNNPQNISINGVVINGVVYTPITPAAGLITIKMIPDTLGGEVNLVVTHLIYQHLGLTVTQALVPTYSTTVQVIGGLDIVGFGMADGKDYVNWHVTNELITIELDNPYAYQIYQLVVLYDDREVIYNSNQIQISNGQTIFLDWLGPEGQAIPLISDGMITITLKSMTYGFTSDKTKTDFFDDVAKHLYLVTSDVIQHVYSMTDFMNLKSGRVTSIHTDLDFTTVTNWVPKDYIGVILGNGYRFSNLSIFVTNTTATTQYYGLFKNFVGRVDNLILDNFTIDVTSVGDIHAGLISASTLNTGLMTLNEVRIFASSIRVVTQGIVQVGAMSGGSGIITNSYLDQVTLTIRSTASAGNKTNYLGGMLARLMTNTRQGSIERAYTRALSIDVETLTNTFVGGFSGLGSSTLTLDQVFHSQLILIVTTPQTLLHVDYFASLLVEGNTKFIGNSSVSKINQNQLTLITGENVIEDALFKTDFIYSDLGWQANVWTYLGKSGNTYPFIIEPFTVVFISNGGQAVETITADYLTPINLPNLTKTGYTFVGWYSDSSFENLYTTAYVPLDGVTLYAKFAINAYTISFESHGGSVVGAITQDYATVVSEPADPTRDGYTFVGWFIDAGLSEAYVFTTMPAEDITLYAKFAINEYTISYELADGINGDNPETYTIESATITLADPTKAGYTFMGWYGEANFSGEAITSMASGSFGDVTLYAKFAINLQE